MPWFATPHLDHARQIEQAAAAGEHVVVEKPFTLTRASVAAVTKAGVTLGLGHKESSNIN